MRGLRLRFWVDGEEDIQKTNRESYRTCGHKEIQYQRNTTVLGKTGPFQEEIETQPTKEEKSFETS